MNNYSFKRKVLYLMIAIIIVILQVLSTAITFGSFPITLTMIPITLSGLLFGRKVGATMGFVFGIYVAITCIFGMDAYGAILFANHPVIIITTVLVKGVIAVILSITAFNLIKNKKVAIIVASLITPLINTLILELSLVIFFDTALAVAASAFISINVIIEVVANLVLVPILYKTFKYRVI